VVYSILRDYVTAIVRACEEKSTPTAITNPVVFRGFLLLFPEVAERVRDRFNGVYSTNNFAAVMAPAFVRMKKTTLEKPGGSIKELRDALSNSLRQSFSLGL